jgi:hypothetical protein
MLEERWNYPFIASIDNNFPNLLSGEELQNAAKICVGKSILDVCQEVILKIKFFPFLGLMFV